MGEIVMDWAGAFYELKNGNAVKRANWLGYWVVEDGELKMYCKDGRIVTFSNCDVMFTLENMAARDWVVVPDGLRAELDKIRESGIFKKEN